MPDGYSCHLWPLAPRYPCSGVWAAASQTALTRSALQSSRTRPCASWRLDWAAACPRSGVALAIPSRQGTISQEAMFGDAPSSSAGCALSSAPVSNWTGPDHVSLALHVPSRSLAVVEGAVPPCCHLLHRVQCTVCGGVPQCCGGYRRQAAPGVAGGPHGRWELEAGCSSWSELERANVTCSRSLLHYLPACLPRRGRLLANRCSVRRWPGQTRPAALI